MGASYSGSRMLGTVLLVTGAVLDLLGVAWVAVNAIEGILEPGGLVLGLIFLSVFTVPMILAGAFLRRRGTVEDLDAFASEQRRRLFEGDRIFRQLLRREAHLAGDLLGSMATRSEGQIAESLQQAHLAMAGLEEAASEQVGENIWLEAAPLNPRDVRNVARYDDLLLAGIRRIRDAAGGGLHPDGAAAGDLLGLARSAQRQFALRQDLLLRGRSLPASSPLHLLKGEIPEDGRTAPESLLPGAAVSMGADDYLVTARLTYFAEGREWYAFVLRGEDGERRLQAEPGADDVLLMEPAKANHLPERVEERGTASVSVDGLRSRAERVVVDYRRTGGEDGLAGWWERWPEGERAYSGHRIGLDELQLWPAAVGGEG